MFYRKKCGQLGKYTYIRVTVLVLFKYCNFVIYLSQARILKHAGDLEAAAALADEARCMDLADRYINSECVKRMLQADQVLNLN